MPFLVLTDTALPTVPRGADAVIRKAGDILSDDEVDPITQQRLVDGDPHTRAILAPVNEDQAHQLRVGRIALDLFTSRTRENRAQDRPVATTPARALRWSDTNPGNAEHVAELEHRLASLERRVMAVESATGAGAERS